jgi:Helix-turn-helix domain/Bacterial regulatory proteins, gntR family
MGEPVKRNAVIQLVRQKIADGTLKPGAPVSATALARESGTGALTGRKALRLLLADGTLTQGVSRNARLRVAGSGTSSAVAVQASREALSRALADLRHASGLTQPDLAVKLGVSVTTVGHAETGRTWQGPGFWRQADDLLDGDGSLVRLHDRYREALAAGPGSAACSQPESGPQPRSPAGANPVSGEEARTASAGLPLPGDADEQLLSLLKPAERAAVRDAGWLYTFIATHVIADGPTREDDLAELRAPIHVIQRMVLAQAAARAYPKEFRLLGGLVATEATGEQRT